MLTGTNYTVGFQLKYVPFKLISNSQLPVRRSSKVSEHGWLIVILSMMDEIVGTCSGLFKF